MKRLREKVFTIMQSREPYPLVSLATLLHAASLLYGAVISKRQALFATGRLQAARLSCAVISVGNITVGGTGKTPMTRYLAHLLGELGYKVTILSRGYKGGGEKKGAVVSDGARVLCDVRCSGDEPLMLAKSLAGVPVVVGRNRRATGRLAIERFDPQVILLDDGFQHQRLARDLDIVLLDSRAPLGNSFLTPRGSLREPISALARADAVIFTRCDDAQPRQYERIAKLTGGVPLFCAAHRPILRGVVSAGSRVSRLEWGSWSLNPAAALSGRRVAAFSGLAHNRPFWNTIADLGGQLADTMGFDDHHPYAQSDIERIVHTAKSARCDCLVTTEKDLARLPQRCCLPIDLVVLGMHIDFGDQARRWRRYIATRLEAVIHKRGNYSA